MLHSTFFRLGKDLHLRFLRLPALLTLGSVVPLFGQVVIDGDFSDWSSLGQSSGNEVLEVEDAADLGDSSGDVAKISATTDGTNLILTMESHGVIAPSADETPEGKTNRYYYHWLIDSDNNPATGVSNATYENKSTLRALSDQSERRSLCNSDGKTAQRMGSMLTTR